MLVILVVAIAGIWIGACLWRRRYVRRKDRAFELGKHGNASGHHASWGPGAGSAAHIPYAHNPAAAAAQQASMSPAYGRGANPNQNPNTPRGKGPGAAGVFMPQSTTTLYDEKPNKVREKKRWVVKERT